MSWNLSPEDLLDAGYLPSLWAMQKTALRVLLNAVLGSFSIYDLAQADASTLKRLVNAPRKRKPQISYPRKTLS
jgi:hypothetical protein